MWIVATACTSAECAAEDEFVVDSLEAADELVCECGYCVVTVSVASFEPVHGRPRLRLVAPPPHEGNESIAPSRAGLLETYASTCTTSSSFSTEVRWPMPSPGGLIEFSVSSPWR
jgi:hypothetical protein